MLLWSQIMCRPIDRCILVYLYVYKTCEVLGANKL